ncbi:MotA/TolQ/ExbB proton channel family protein [Spongiibacter sp. KMU-158]|uniref:MotA/TolQ/ExbB proton channel family protein n=1 Tax=Spongiibacter pelagi TaxID=2760804 RepID=A0A927C3G0_9GAMM|nr:MotA/TolQ/ExbB proton channel family protein [Spongiibacter pelagi]MBD2859071.1 MotA/TolQ/ExbB proton channel family protein [Spongiibacter pelagi]
MLELVKAGGWLMLPIILSSIVAMAICVERFLALNPEKIAPRKLLNQVWGWMQQKQLDADKIRQLRAGSPLGQILAAGLANAKYGREVMKENIEDVASHVVHEMERYLNALGTISAVTPLLGLLGTVLGMIRVFSEIMVQGTGNAGVLAGGISEALITTASGLCVAIPALIMHRYFLRRIDTIVVTMEQDAIRLINAVHGDVKIQGAATAAETGTNA